MMNFRNLSKKGMVGAFLLVALNGTANAMDQAPQSADVKINFHATMEATNVRIIVKDAATGQVVTTFNQEGDFKLPVGAYTFEVSGLTDAVSMFDFTQSGVFDLQTYKNQNPKLDRVESPCEFFSDGSIQSKVVIDPSNVKMPILITVLGNDNPRENQRDSVAQYGPYMASQIGCQIVRADVIQ